MAASRRSALWQLKGNGYAEDQTQDIRGGCLRTGGFHRGGSQKEFERCGAA